MDLLLLWHIVEMKLKLVSVMNFLKDDANYEREDAVNDLLEILKELDGLENQARREG